MKSLRFLFIWGCIFCVAGCSFISFKGSSVNTDDVAVSAKVVDGKRLKQGGKFLIVPFRAGSGVAQTEELQRISLMIAKGMIETFESNYTPFRIIADEQTEPDVTLRGHITNFKEQKGVKRLISDLRRIDMAVEGEIIEEETGRTLLHFSCRREIREKSPDIKEAAYAMGREIGKTVIDSLQ